MAAKAYNPFQTEFATEDELLGNPYSGLKRNPSKAYETIVAAEAFDARHRGHAGRRRRHRGGRPSRSRSTPTTST